MKKIGLITLQKKMSGDLIETFEIFDGIYNYGRHFSISLLKVEIYCQDRFKKLSPLTNWIFSKLSNIFFEQIA